RLPWFPSPGEREGNFRKPVAFTLGASLRRCQGARHTRATLRQHHPDPASRVWSAMGPHRQDSFIRPKGLVMKRRTEAAIAVIALTGSLLAVGDAPSQAGPRGRFAFDAPPGRPQLSGAADPRVLNGTGVTTLPGAAAAAAVASDDAQANGDNKSN